MKYAILAGALVFGLCAGVCEAGEEGAACSSGQAVTDQEAVGEAGDEKGIKHLDLADDSEESVNRVGTMSPGQSYDDDTGMPNTVESDSDMNLQ